ncbi:MAG TPA: choice-of-anchor Q domain-containing protein [Anaerolineae bacterium]|nr:choice-of-anchor Q domain-containing protein [Anaerolineae bacterium]
MMSLHSKKLEILFPTLLLITLFFGTFHIGHTATPPISLHASDVSAPSFTTAKNRHQMSETLPPTCFVETTGDNITDYSSTNADAIQLAINDIMTTTPLIKVAGRCAGVQMVAGVTQTVYISQALTLQGGYTHTNWLGTPDPTIYETILDAEGGGRVLFVTDTTAVTFIKMFTLRGGDARQAGLTPNGGGIYNKTTSYALIVDNSLVTDNIALNGGGVYNDEGFLIIRYTTLANNSALDTGGALFGEGSDGTSVIYQSIVINNNALYGGAVGAGDNYRADIQRSTITHNTAAINGGAIALIGNNSYASPFYSTIVNNTTGSNGYAIYINDNNNNLFSFQATIVANGRNNCNIPITSTEYNLESADSCGLNGIGDLINTDPLLKPLADNGGETLTYALQNGSPALNQIPPDNCTGRDQRSVSRPQFTFCDIGAYENDQQFPPIARDDLYRTAIDTPLTVMTTTGLLNNDIDSNSDPLTITLQTTPQGDLTLNNLDGSFDYTPPPGFSGITQFTYQLDDGQNHPPTTTNITTATIAVVPPTALPPLTTPDTYTTTPDTPLIIIPATSTVTFSATSNTPITDNNYDGSLQSMACDVIDTTSLAPTAIIEGASLTMSLDHTWVGDLTAKLVTPRGHILPLFSRPNYAETADNGAGCCGDDSNLTASARLNFYDTAPYDPETMGITIPTTDYICQDDGQCDFFPNPDTAAGLTSFADLTGKKASGLWQLCLGDSAGGDIGSLASWDLHLVVSQSGVLANDTPRNGYALQATVVTPPTNGALSLNKDGTFHYIPDLGFIGVDTFTYYAKDWFTDSTPTTATIHVTPLNKCWTEYTGDNTFDFASPTANALHQALAAAPANSIIKIAGDCAGVTFQNGMTQTAYLDQDITLQGGFVEYNWLTDPNTKVYTTTLSATGAGRVLYIAPTAAVTLSHLALTGGQINGADQGAAIYNDGSLLLQYSLIQANMSQNNGGGLYNGNTAVVNNSGFIYNHADADGGAIYNQGDLTVTNSTFSANSSNNNGAFLYQANGSATLTHNTITTNNSDADSNNTGLAAFYRNNGTATLQASILAGNTVATTTPASNSDCYNPPVDMGHNLVGISGGCSLTTNSSQTILATTLFTNILLPLTNQGTHPLATGSPAIDYIAGNSCLVADDQQEIARPQGLNCDIGASEYQGTDTAIAPALTINQLNNSAELNWSTPSTNCVYAIYHSVNPYSGFTLYQTYLTAGSWLDNDVIGDGLATYYFVRAYACGNNNSAISNTVAEFDVMINSTPLTTTCQRCAPPTKEKIVPTTPPTAIDKAKSALETNRSP